jgi:hypothetical protein
MWLCTFAWFDQTSSFDSDGHEQFNGSSSSTHPGVFRFDLSSFLCGTAFGFWLYSSFVTLNRNDLESRRKRIPFFDFSGFVYLSGPSLDSRPYFLSVNFSVHFTVSPQATMTFLLQTSNPVFG